jgi:Kdo2-lipid IVA lauroyltransferase/acyltransferase
MRIVYYLFIKPLSMLPLEVLYAIAYPFYLILVYVVRYRQRVVVRNLKNSFPEKSNREIHQIKRAFYRHFFDFLLESLRMLSISTKELEQRMHLVNPELLDKFHDQGKHVVAIVGHCFNWEFLPAINTKMKLQFVALYKSLENPFMNQVIYNSRTANGSVLIDNKEIMSFFRKKDQNPSLIFFVADQSPRWKSKLHWTTFLNQQTAVVTGPERYAQTFDLPVVFGEVRKLKRGHYEVEFHLLEEFPKQTQEGEITEKHVRKLEEIIQKRPELWLWTHKRWKKKTLKNLNQ